MIKWLNAVIDIPAQHFDTAAAFWANISNSRFGEIHPEHDEFVHLLPESGDMHLELQRIDKGPARVHLDLVVDDIPGDTERAIELGATLVDRPGHSVLTTPGGMLFCIVPHGGESERPSVIDEFHPHAADQICLDIPYEHFDADIAFWSAMTGWDVNPAPLSSEQEYRSFAQPEQLPLRILLQRLGEDDKGAARAHLDLSTGEHLATLIDTHVDQGATVLNRTKYWTVLVDPAGQPYCLTSRPPSH